MGIAEYQNGGRSTTCTGLFLGHIIELEAAKGLFDTGKPSRSWYMSSISLHSASFTGSFGQKWLFLAQN